MAKDWRVYLVRKTVIRRVHGRPICGVLLRRDKRILVGRHTKHYSYQTLVHELAGKVRRILDGLMRERFAEQQL